MEDGRVNSSSVFKLLLVLLLTSFAGHSSLSLLRNGMSATQTSNETTCGMIPQYIKVCSMTSMINRSVYHFGFKVTKVCNPYRCKRKYLSSKFRYYPPTLISISKLLNPGPSFTSWITSILMLRRTKPTHLRWSTLRVQLTTVPVCINNGRYAHMNHLYYHRQLGHNPLNCIDISSTSTFSKISTFVL